MAAVAQIEAAVVQHVSAKPGRLVRGFSLPAERSGENSSDDESDQQRQLDPRLEDHLRLGHHYAVCEDQRVQRQWPHATGLMFSSAGSAAG